MALEIHAVVKYAANFDAAVIANTVKQEVPRTLDSPDGSGNAASTVRKVVGPHGGRNLRPAMSAGPIGISCYIQNRADEQSLVPQPRLVPEVFMRPGKN